MGQYYVLTCPETSTYVNAHAMGAFVKAYEQVWSDSIPAALAFLCSAGRGAADRDLPWAPAGPWAGRMPLMVGDYAETGDLLGRDRAMRHPEGGIYDRCKGKAVRLDAKPAARASLQDLSTALIPIFERTRDLRNNRLRQDGTSISEDCWTTDFIPVKKSGDGWDLSLDHVEVTDRQDTMDYFTRLGAFKNTCWQRPPIDIRPDMHFLATVPAPDQLPPAETDPGAAMLWVNLDREEIIDPAAMGDVPDLAGVINGMSARAVLASLVFHVRRGGGDLGDLGPVAMAGRWRGDRIVLLGPEPFKPPRGKTITQAEARARFTDVTRNAQAFIECDEIFGRTGFSEFAPARDTLDPMESAILGAALDAPAAREIVATHGPRDIAIRIFPPARLEDSAPGQAPLKAPIDLAGSVDLYHGEGKIFLPPEIRAHINTLVQALPRKVLQLHGTGEDRYRTLSADLSDGVIYSPHSNHDLLSAIGQAA